mgnify:CR=1 FL=1
MSGDHRPGWRENSRVFDEYAAEYDRWFDESLLFEIERTALQTILPPDWRPSLEIGVGPGRFAQAMHTTFGLDPAQAPLHLAGQRGIITCQGQAEALPFRSNSLQGIALLFTLCFLASPRQALDECARVLKADGQLMLGFVPAQSVWGQTLEKKKKANHPFYRTARFQTVARLRTILQDSGFKISQSCSTLYQKPGQVTTPETPEPGLDEQAGFVALLCGPNSIGQ